MSILPAYAKRAYTWPSRSGCPSLACRWTPPSLEGLRTGLYERGGPWVQQTVQMYIKQEILSMTALFDSVTVMLRIKLATGRYEVVLLSPAKPLKQI